MTDITEEAATEVGEESKADEASAKKERIDSLKLSLLCCQ